MTTIADGIKLYLPSNGTERAEFEADYCKCEREYQFLLVDSSCPILLRALAFDLCDSDYPREWRYDGDRPICTAFVPLGDPLPPLRDDKTVDMFGDKP